MSVICDMCIHREGCYGEEIVSGGMCEHFRHTKPKPMNFFTKKYHCRDCEWLSEEKKSIGNRCVNTKRKTRKGRFDTNEFKYPSCPACKTGFKLKEK